MKSKKQTVDENIDKIKEWLRQGVTMQDIAKNLQMSRQTLYKYVNLDDLDTIKNCREPLVQELENTMYQSATGFTKTVKKYVKLKQCEYFEGRKLREWEEMQEYEEEVYFPPDTTAGIFLLKNWGKYMNEPRALEIRKKEVELKEKQIEAQNW